MSDYKVPSIIKDVDGSYCHCWDKCPCDEKFKALTQTLATERDQFGKREIELMQENRDLREALEKIIFGKGHDPIDDEDCTMGECDCNFRLAKAALAKSGDRHE